MRRKEGGRKGMREKGKQRGMKKRVEDGRRIEGEMIKDKIKRMREWRNKNNGEEKGRKSIRKNKNKRRSRRRRRSQIIGIGNGRKEE